MKTKLILGLACVLTMSLAACSGGDGTDDGGLPPTPDAYVPVIDTAPAPIDTAPAPDPFVWVVVQDTEQIACSTNGPGPDIDAVALLDAAGTVVGWGKVGTAVFTPNPGGNSCDNVDCSGGLCKYALVGNYLLESTLTGYTEGPSDAMVMATGDDYGYFSLNGGTLQIQIGDATGGGTAQAIKSGDYIQVFEVDKMYITANLAPATCSCLPEHYTVTLQSALGTVLPLVPTAPDADNAAACAAAVASAYDGCGSTVFVVP